MTNNDTKGNTMANENENVDREDEWNTNWQNDADEVAHILNSRHIRRVTMSLCECEACNG